ncbi:acetylglutamate kinase [Amycolatopsis coloradensis]|uniref:Acetylglutamate kinase n=1 Tax=Amycolatopsis coloradensis TaxID=76021 RepID=A0A1R0KG61_9PSEU|nr:[LysW]-aminoadipate kinase [Amycolatopsis coloradensis]OLZ44534.1 acetylglutamate kinase [Amycolatopsis coloradensis]
MTDELLVVKIGGAAGVDPGRVCADVAARVHRGRRIVLTHGGSASVDELAGELGVPQRELLSASGVRTRHTDPATLRVLQLALLGEVRPAVLTELGRAGIRAVGLSGLDANLLRAERRVAIRAIVDGHRVLVRDDHSGRITSVDGGLLRLLLDDGVTPVVSPPAVAEDGRPVNANADRIAAAVAVELKARTLVFLTAAPGLLADPADPASLLAEHALGDDTPKMGGGMGVKLIAAREALRGGVETVIIADGRAEDPVTQALDGGGTRLRLAPA